MNTYRKQVPPRKPQTYSPAQLVRDHGDRWVCFVPNNATRVSLYSSTVDDRDACAMRLMEQGLIGRVE